MTEPVNVCANDACGARDADGEWVRTATTRVFCDRCEIRVRDFLANLPDVYVRLHIALGEQAGGQEKVSGSRELPVPIRLGVEELIDELEGTVFGWEDALRAALKVPASQRLLAGRYVPVRVRVSVPTDDVVRECAHAWGLDGWAATEAVRLGVWRPVRTPATAQASRKRGLRFAESCGWLLDRLTPLLASAGGETAGLELMALETRARAALGATRLVHRLPAPCPSCDLVALQREDGKDEVRCTACYRVLEPEEYERLVLVLASENRPPTKRKAKSA